MLLLIYLILQIYLYLLFVSAIRKCFPIYMFLNTYFYIEYVFCMCRDDETNLRKASCFKTILYLIYIVYLLDLKYEILKRTWAWLSVVDVGRLTFLWTCLVVPRNDTVPETFLWGLLRSVPLLRRTPASLYK